MPFQGKQFLQVRRLCYPKDDNSHKKTLLAADDKQKEDRAGSFRAYFQVS